MDLWTSSRVEMKTGDEIRDEIQVVLQNIKEEPPLEIIDVPEHDEVVGTGTDTFEPSKFENETQEKRVKNEIRDEIQVVLQNIKEEPPLEIIDVLEPDEVVRTGTDIFQPSKCENETQEKRIKNRGRTKRHETPEEQKLRQQRLREYHREDYLMRKANETPEDREHRLSKKRKNYVIQKLDYETVELRERRLRQSREYYRNYKNGLILKVYGKELEMIKRKEIEQ